MSKGEHLGYSHQGCTTDMAIVPLQFKNSTINIYRIIFANGFFFLGSFTVMASVVLLQVLLKALSMKMEACNYSFDYYGIFWGMSVILFMLLMLVLYRDITLLSNTTFNPDIRQEEYTRYFWPFVLAPPIIFCAPVAIYFGVKFKLTIPSVYLLPAKLLCCCNEKRAQTLVVSLALWFNMVTALHIVGRCAFLLYAFTVAPFVVAVNVMLLVLTFMCLTYAMALVFTVCAFIGTRRCLRSKADCFATVRAAMLIPFLLSIICFSFVAALSGQFVNTATQQNSFPMILKSVFAPVLLAIMSLSLKWFISGWLRLSPDGVEGDNVVTPLHGQEYNRYQAIDNVVVDNMP